MLTFFFTIGAAQAAVVDVSIQPLASKSFQGLSQIAPAKQPLQLPQVETFVADNMLQLELLALCGLALVGLLTRNRKRLF
ncbi:hypothetical protein NT239_08460 [Chitinibacter sp. SCUT-21]|uniref:hypothetical protein n=1 Tax=Chitinibacter sp. SCUT-21 TaxID=2970891 RepID=UPI0035A5E9C2